MAYDIPMIGSLDTSDGAKELGEQIKNLTATDIGFGTVPEAPAAGSTADTDSALMEARLDVLDLVRVRSVSLAFAFDDMTDGLGTSGYIDFAADSLPVGAVVLGWVAVTTTGFTGDTTAVLMVGVSGDTDRFSADTTKSVLTTGTVGSAPLAADAWDNIGATNTPRVTITGSADFTSISAGEATVTIFYIDVLNS